PPLEGSANCWLSVIVNPCSRATPDTACTIPGRSGLDRVRTTSRPGSAVTGSESRCRPACSSPHGAGEGVDVAPPRPGRRRHGRGGERRPHHGTGHDVGGTL